MEIKYIPVDSLTLDLENPRIARIVSMYKPGDLKAEHIALALGSGDSQEGDTYTTFSSLKESIRTNGGIIQPVIVNKKINGQLIVIEGNTRVQIYRDFVKAGLDGDWKNIPAAVHNNLAHEQVDAIRLQAHLVGPRPWDPYSKAKYIVHLRNNEQWTLDRIVDFCGGRRKQVSDYIAAYQDMEEYYRPAAERAGSVFDTSRFSAFVELQRPSILTALVEARYSEKNFSEWVSDELFKSLPTIRQLSRILDDESAKTTKLENGAQEAIRLLDSRNADTNLEDASIIQLAQELSRRIVGLDFEDIKRLRDDTRNDERDILFDTKSQIDELFTFIGEGA